MYKYNRNFGSYNWIFIIGAIGVVVTFNFYWLFAILLTGIILAVRLSQKNVIPELVVTTSSKGKNFSEGDRINIPITLHNTSLVPFQGEIVDIVPEGTTIWKGTNVFLLSIMPGEKVNLQYEITFVRRGKYTIGPIKLRHLSTGGIHEYRWTVDLYKELVIVPTPAHVSTYSIPPSFLLAITGLFRSKLLGEGLDFAGVREYRSGDPMKRINWKQTAKHHQLYANEFELHRSSKILLVLDLTEESRQIADASVRAALGLANFLVNSRTRVGIMTMSEYIHYIPPRTGKRHLLEISQYLTTAESTGQLREPELFSRRLNSTITRVGEGKHEVVLFSSLNRPENAQIFSSALMRLGRITVLAPSGITLPQETNRKFELAKRLLELRKSTIRRNMMLKGMRVFEWNPDLPFEASMKSWRYDR